jgi:hypothetical protein
VSRNLRERIPAKHFAQDRGILELESKPQKSQGEPKNFSSSCQDGQNNIELFFAIVYRSPADTLSLQVDYDNSSTD